jgi:hypothetical protein
MALDWDDAALAQIEGGGVRPAILVRIATDPLIRLWTGAVSDLAIGADVVETTDGAIYQGMGVLTNVPAVNQLLNGQAERIEFTISGAAITGEIAAIASTEAAAIRGAKVNMGLLAFDSNWQIASPTAWLWEGYADSLGVDRKGDAKNPTRGVKLAVGSLMTGRRRPAIGYWTDPDQRQRSADDSFFDRVRQYSIQTTKVWPV